MKDAYSKLPVFFLDYLVPLIITAGVAVLLFGKAVSIAYPKGDTPDTFYALTQGFDKYYEFRTAWKPRLFSTALASITVRVSNWVLARTEVLMVRRPLDLVLGLWTSGWFVLSSLFLIWFLGRRSVFYVFGLYAGITFGYLTRLEWAARAYPWDMPALFFYTVFVLFFIQKKYWLIFFIIPLGTGFKETVMILSLGFLLIDIPWKRRLLLFSGCMGLTLLVKIVIDYYTRSPLLLTMETRMNGDQSFNLYLWNNLESFLSFFPYLINAGTLLVFYLLPNVNQKILHLKLISIPFVLGILLFGNVSEYRIWFELIPFALYAIDVVMYNDPLKLQPAPVGLPISSAGK